MIVRIVKLSIEPSKIPKFIANFNANKTKIRQFDGCNHLKLLQDKHASNLFFTYSYWQSESHLNTYRSSNLFTGIWENTKPLFNGKPEAWSLTILEELQ